MSRDAQLYVADVVAAGEAILRYIEGVTFEAFSANDEKRAAVERQLFVIGESSGPAAGRMAATMSGRALAQDRGSTQSPCAWLLDY